MTGQARWGVTCAAARRFRVQMVQMGADGPPIHQPTPSAELHGSSKSRAADALLPACSRAGQWLAVLWRTKSDRPLQRTSPVSEGVLFQSGLPAVPRVNGRWKQVAFEMEVAEVWPSVVDGTGKLAGEVAESRAEGSIHSQHPSMDVGGAVFRLTKSGRTAIASIPHIGHHNVLDGRLVFSCLWLADHFLTHKDRLR